MKKSLILFLIVALIGLLSLPFAGAANTGVQINRNTVEISSSENGLFVQAKSF